MWPSSMSTQSEGQIHLIDFSAENSAPSSVDISAGSEYDSFFNFDVGAEDDLTYFPIATPTPSSYMLIRATLIPLHRSKTRYKEVKRS